jgi:glycogen(starch) synthase
VKVLCISTDFPPHGLGGYEQQCRDTTEYLRRRGHSVRVLAGEASAAASDARDGVHRRLPRFAPVPEPVGARVAWQHEQRSAAALRSHLAAFGPDVVCLWRLGELSMSLPARAAAAGVPVVGVVCDPWMLDGPRHDPWARSGAAPPLPAAARWLFASTALRHQVAAGGITVQRAEIVSPGVELAGFPLAPAQRWRGRLLYAGRLSPLKGVDLAIAAVRELPAGVTLDVAGRGSPAYERLLRETMGTLGLAGRVRFHGTLTRAQVARAYAAADAVLFPVRWPEPFGLVPLEAMASGTPVIAVPAGGAAGYLSDGMNALLVPPEDPGGIAAAVRRLASDPTLRERLRTGGRQTAEQHPADRSHRAIAAALEAAAGAGARADEATVDRRPSATDTSGPG